VDPRVSRSRAAVIRAATDLLVEGGPSAVTIDAIVARSGVAKSTIYRHWQARDEVLLAVIEECAPRLPEPDPDSDVVTALRQTMHAVAATLNDPEWARVIPALLMLKNHEAGVRAIDERLEHEQDEILTSLIQRAMDEGVLAPDVDVPEAITHLLGPLLFAHLTEVVAVDKAFADRTLERFLAAYRPPG
jgi:AcrR family transcriptional regulator